MAKVDMTPKARKKPPAAAIPDIEACQEIPEQLEDIKDLKMLAKMRKKPLKFKKLEDFLEEYQPGV